jgi:hypothetical protein
MIRTAFFCSPRKINTNEAKNTDKFNIIPMERMDQLFNNVSQLQIQYSTRDYFVMQVGITNSKNTTHGASNHYAY